MDLFSITEDQLFNVCLFLLLITGLFVFVLLFFVTAPYGRHTRKGWGPGIENKTAWVIMEAFPPIVFVCYFFFGTWKTGLMPVVFIGLWMIHYLYRAFLFPFLLRGRKIMPLSILLFGIIFNTVNAYTQGRYLFFLSPGIQKYSADWILTPQFITGAALFLTGFFLHVSSDSITRNLRRQGETEYKIPFGGMYRWISCPNYLGEIIQWAGWALLTWSIPGLLFAFWTAANLIPRAASNHKWYKKNFNDYPSERKAVIPFIL